MKLKLLLIALFLIAININLYGNSKVDSLKVYQLGDINVFDSSVDTKISQTNISSINYFSLQKTDVVSASELQMYIPSARIRTNSRGESMLFLRGAGERQLGLFFDGVPLNVAWDNRFDLSMLPIDIIGKMDVNRNANSILYGTNVLGGAINISTIERSTDGIGGNIRFQGGSGSLMQLSATNDGKFGNFNYIASVSKVKTDGLTLSKNRPDTLKNQNLNSDFRDNTDRDFLSMYARGEYDFAGSAKLGITVLRIEGEKGVGAETHIKPTAARFWRYPDWSRTLISLNGDASLSPSGNVKLRTTFWYDIFNQKIDAFSNSTLQNISSKQSDEDITIGSRNTISWSMNENHSLLFSINWFNTHHKELIDSNPESLFSQNVLSNGMSYEYKRDLFSLKTGLVYDYVNTGDAGLFKEAIGKEQSDYGVFLTLRHLLDENTIVFGNFSRRTRFPTMRESYSGALDRFVINPDLKPETGNLFELGINHSASNFNVEFSGFANFYDGLIEQIRLTKQQDSLRRRIRVNYSEATIMGLDLTLRFAIIDNLNFEANVTYMKSFGKQDTVKLDNIDNRPEILSGLILNYRFGFGLFLQGEMETTGKQFERSPDNASKFIEIGATSIFNFRLSYQFAIETGFNSLYEIFARVNNIADTYRISQLGLPEQGRMITAGVKISI
jgi:iron complex outermembrane receptor protein